jgi:cell division protein FtsB
VVPDWLNLEHLLPLGLLAVVITVTPVMVLCPSGLPRVRHLEAERNRVESQISTLTREIAQLGAEVKRIKSDPTAVEQVARDELGLVRQTEVVFLFGP